jgi:hypothetical protein
MAMASDIAFYVGQWNTEGWYDESQFEDVDTIIAETGHLFKDIQQFDDNQLDAFGAWVDERTNDGKMDIIWLNGCVPSVLYPFPNLEPDGSRAEEWLDGGNMIINVGDWFGYVSYEGGSRETANAGDGAANILDLSSGIIVSDDSGPNFAVTPTAKKYVPSLDDPCRSVRPVVLNQVQDPWEVAFILASPGGSEDPGEAQRADPVVLHNTETDGYVAIINQASVSCCGNVGWLSDRGQVVAELIGNWVNNVIAFGVMPLATAPNPKDGVMLEDTWVNLSWRAGDFAVSHDVYLGDNFDDVNNGAEGTFQGNQAVNNLIVGFPGFAYPGGLVPGTTYYWRIDEVNDADPNSPWKGNIWSFWIPPYTAYNPSPADGVKFVPTDAELSWTTGFHAKLHTVYFGDNFDDVNNATVGIPSASNTYDPGTLELEKTYYWRVDEFDGVTTVKGDVWSFSTIPNIAITDPSLIGWWKLDEGMGTTVVDWSGHGNHGTFAGDPQWDAGQIGGALELDGGDDYVSFVSTSNWPAGTSSRSMCGWGKTDSVAGGWRWIAAYGSAGTSLAMFIGMNGTSLYGGGYGDDVLEDDFWEVGVWHHICLTYDGNVAKLYADGVEVDSQTKNWDLALGRAHIGRQVNDLAEFWDGLVDDVRIYNRVLTPEEIKLAMRGDPLVAWDPNPTNGSTPYIREATPLSWSPGDNASQHDVYFGTDRGAVADADASDTTGIYRGRQGVTIYTPAEGVEWAGGPYYWRVDEYNTDATISKGNIWSFTVTDFILIDDIEDYNDYPPDEIFSTWIDGWEVPTNGSLAGHPDPPFAETGNVHGGRQSMPVYYENNFKYSGITMTLAYPRNWTEEGVGVLSLWFYGDAANAAELMYVNLNGIATVYHNDPSAALIDTWTEWRIDLQEFSTQGVDLANVNTISIGFGDKNNLQAGGSGMVLFDDIRLYRPPAP